jgi:peptidyl-prolyl cis-trans isomerase A (cyclophilin A)
MRRLGRTIWDLLRDLAPHRPAPRASARGLQLEALEDRFLPAVGTVAGVVFVDAHANGVRAAGELTLPGANVTLAGQSDQGTPVRVSATTDANGNFTFQNLFPGTYQLTATLPTGFLGRTNGTGGLTVLSNFHVSGGQTVSQDLASRGLAPGSVTLRQFLSSSRPTDIPTGGSPGTGLAQGGVPAPFVKVAIANVSVSRNALDSNLDLAGNFDDPNITDSQVRLDTSAGPIHIELFDRQAPRTVANFFNYVLAGQYNNSIFHRSVPGFVLQGGGFTFRSGPPSLVTMIPERPTVQNEFGPSNTRGTIAMALKGSDINSATDQFFFNLVDNSSSLDGQSFTVFGKLVGPADQQVVDALAAIPTRDESSVNGAFSTLPLSNYSGTNFPSDTTAANFALIRSAVVERRTDFLTYSVVSNSNPSLVTPTVTNNRLTLHYAANQTGTATIQVRATDQTGASVDAPVRVTVL